VYIVGDLNMASIVIPEKFFTEVNENLKIPINSNLLELLQASKLNEDDCPNHKLISNLNELLSQLSLLEYKEVLKFLELIRKRLLTSKSLSNDEKLTLCQLERRLMNIYLKQLIKKHDIST
jgi:hypothetical protein